MQKDAVFHFVWMDLNGTEIGPSMSKLRVTVGVHSVYKAHTVQAWNSEKVHLQIKTIIPGQIISGY